MIGCMFPRLMTHTRSGKPIPQKQQQGKNGGNGNGNGKRKAGKQEENVDSELVCSFFCFPLPHFPPDRLFTISFILVSRSPISKSPARSTTTSRPTPTRSSPPHTTPPRSPPWPTSSSAPKSAASSTRRRLRGWVFRPWGGGGWRWARRSCSRLTWTGRRLRGL
jgi:hypothetical protein